MVFHNIIFDQINAAFVRLLSKTLKKKSYPSQTFEWYTCIHKWIRIIQKINKMHRLAGGPQLAHCFSNLAAEDAPLKGRRERESKLSKQVKNLAFLSDHIGAVWVLTQWEEYKLERRSEEMTERRTSQVGCIRRTCELTMQHRSEWKIWDEH